ncbi:helix-turn-helix transcriptional regulator [Chloroflexota bacterium]
MFTNRIREFREQVGLTQVELARRVHTASTNISSIERGKLAPWPKVTKRLCKAFKCTKDELFPAEKGGGDGE